MMHVTNVVRYILVFIVNLLLLLFLHSYRNIDGLDYQILVEADFLVNMYEDKADMDTIIKAYDNIFVTESGKRLCRQLFSLKY